MHSPNTESQNHLAAITDAVVVVEKSLAAMPGSRHSSCVYELGEHAAYFRDDPSDRVCLRFGRIRNHAGECLHVEVSDEHGEPFYTVWIGDEALPAGIRVALAGRAPTLIRLATNDGDDVNAELLKKTARAVMQASKDVSGSAHKRHFLW
ncbi:hypothetical protein [Planctomycetes bacterium TBK1r]|uniref:Uncharacterized protein n=1 Tax=Stieleria magnilauensis TaxID=2527963 RepID=A0ABX5Y0N8_9BACT|nr:hypothetical protein TBK1r_63920 [Planctomycetes bacterium TBK1r]